MSESERDLVAKIMAGTRIATLTYTDEQGRLVSTPMGTQDFEDPSVVWFITEADSDKVRAIQQNPNVNVAYASDDGWISLSGAASLNTHRAKLRELWDPSASVFMAGDADDSNSALLEVTGDTAQVWESPGKIGMVVTVVKGLLTKDTPAKDEDAPIVDL